MSCLSNTRRAELEAELAEKLTLLEEMKTALSASITGGIKSYKFDSGEGNQSVTYTSPKELKEIIEDLEAEINSIRMRLRGTNLMNFNLRRQTGGVHPRGRR